MTILRAPTSFLTTLGPFFSYGTPYGGNSGGNNGVWIAPTYGPSQAGPAGPQASSSLHLSPSASNIPGQGASSTFLPGIFSTTNQKISLPGGADAQLHITAAVLRQLVNSLLPTFDLGRLPSERLVLSQECACDFQGGWAAVFLQLGFTSFSPTVGQIPVMCC